MFFFFIYRYKEEYAMLISDANVIKNDLSTVEKKVKSKIVILKHFYACTITHKLNYYYLINTYGCICIVIS